MKKIITLLLISFAVVQVSAQNIFIKNNSLCTVKYYIAAVDPACSGSAQSTTYAIPPSSTVTFNFGTTTWVSGTPGLGWVWGWIKPHNGCGPYNYISPNCSGGANQNVCIVSTPCVGFPLSSCMLINTTCNTCPAVKVQWTDLGGGNAQVDMW